ncbi:copper chaperone PCu(A)C [Streptomyces sp. NBC_01003]|uniref:copper chaperone PCu(A)C n=1 Tax=Streptomyces sp. NBC_01003 TaxID=2903714 RepID=UPI00386E5F9A|nr:copper chaperone PCu(A)C [Streptomyces sp. NBC_01003]
MSTNSLWRPTSRRVTAALLTALAPLAACGVALGGLTAWVRAGNAGSPPHIAVTPGRVLMPYGESRDTAAYFELSNSGGSSDQLVAVTSRSAVGEVSLSRHRMAGRGAAYRGPLASVEVPAGGDLAMGPSGVGVTLRAGAGWRAGDVVPFTLRFRLSGPVETVAVVVRPGERLRSAAPANPPGSRELTAPRLRLLSGSQDEQVDQEEVG